METVFLLIVLIQFAIRLYCQDFQQFNSSFSNLNITFFNGSLTHLLMVMFVTHRDLFLFFFVDSSESETHNETHRTSFKTMSVSTFWSYAYNWTSNWTRTSLS